MNSTPKKLRNYLSKFAFTHHKNKAKYEPNAELTTSVSPLELLIVTPMGINSSSQTEGTSKYTHDFTWPLEY